MRGGTPARRFNSVIATIANAGYLAIMRFNRAQVIDENFVSFLQQWDKAPTRHIARTTRSAKAEP